METTWIFEHFVANLSCLYGTPYSKGSNQSRLANIKLVILLSTQHITTLTSQMKHYIEHFSAKFKMSHPGEVRKTNVNNKMILKSKARIMLIDTRPEKETLFCYLSGCLFKSSNHLQNWCSFSCSQVINLTTCKQTPWKLNEILPRDHCFRITRTERINH